MAWDGIAAYCRTENKVSLRFVEGPNNMTRVFQRRAYGLKELSSLESALVHASCVLTCD